MTFHRAPIAALFTALSAVAALALPGRADEKADRLAQRQELLAQMQGLAEKTSVKYTNGESPIKLVDKPVFRYDDQPRRFIDATMWIWTDGGRPVACQKIEA